MRDIKLDRFLAKNQLQSNEIIEFEIGVVASCQKLDIILGNKVF